MNDEATTIRKSLQELRETAKEDILAFYRVFIKDIPQEKWFTDGFEKAIAYAKENRYTGLFPFQSLVSLLNAELERLCPQNIRDVSAKFGLEVKRIVKTSELYVLHTDHGEFSIEGEDLFSQEVFRKKVFAAFGIVTGSLKKAEWEKLLSSLMSIVQKENDDMTVTEIVKAVGEAALRKYTISVP